MPRATEQEIRKRREFVEAARQSFAAEGRTFPPPFAFTRQSANPAHQTWKAAVWHRAKKGKPVDADWADLELGFERFVVAMGERPAGAQAIVVEPGKPWGPGNVRWSTEIAADGGAAAKSGWSGNVRAEAAARRRLVDRIVARCDRGGVLAAWRDKGAFQRQKSNPLFVVWNCALNRCNDPLHPSYKNYGGRGIWVCEDWDCDFENFAAYVLLNIGPRPTSRHTLDRIDPDGDYEPGNIRWATWEEQNQNKRAEHDPERDAQRGPLKMRALAIRAGVLRADGELPDHDDVEG